jgi:hypothetical protein
MQARPDVNGTEAEARGACVSMKDIGTLDVQIRQGVARLAPRNAFATLSGCRRRRKDW